MGKTYRRGWDGEDARDGKHENMSTPSSWNREMHRQPTRRKNHEAARKLKNGEDPDDVSFPLDKKPHKYYW